MKIRDDSEVVVMLAGYTAWAAVNLFNGFSVESLPLIVLFTLLGMSSGTAIFPVLFGCSVLGLISPIITPWAVLVSGLLGCTAGSTVRIRITGFLAVASTLWFSPVAGIPLVVVASLAVLTGKCRLRYIYIPIGFVISALFIGLPGPLSVRPVIAGSFITAGVLKYDIPELNTSRTEVLLVAPFEGVWAVWVAMETGGVRDSIPMAAIRLGEDMLILPSGSDTLSFTMVPGDTVAITLMRDFKPFNHSVIHTTAGGERL